MSYYYHATNAENYDHIISEGIIKTGTDGIVYLADSKENAYKFIKIRQINSDEPIYVFELNLNDSEIEETFDHSYSFFQCKAYGINKDIDLYDSLIDVWVFGENI